MEVKNIEGVKLNHCPLCKHEMKLGYAFDFTNKNGCFAFCDNCNLYFGLNRKEAEKWDLAGMYHTQTELADDWNKKTEMFEKYLDSRLDQEIEKMWDALSTVLDANPTDETLMVIIKRAFRHLIQTGEYDEKTILNAIHKRQNMNL